MKISVIMATYNGEKYIKEQLLTILNQTRRPDEVIICDDISTDKTVEIVKSFIVTNKLSQTWNIEVNKQKKGCEKNFIEGVRKASGDIIFYCDQDDKWDLEKLALMEKGFINYPKMLACCCLKKQIDSFGKEIANKTGFFTRPQFKGKGFHQVSLSNAVKYCYSPGLCLGMTRDFALLTGNFILANDLTHDLPIGIIASIYNEYYILNKVLVEHRVHLSNVSVPHLSASSRTKDSEYQIKGRKLRLNIIETIYREFNNSISSVDNSNMKKKIMNVKQSIQALENHNIVKGFSLLFDINPMINWWISVNNFLCLLRKRK